MSSSTKVTTVALLGSTGKVGGWVLEGLIDTSYSVRVLVRRPEKLDSLSDRSNLTILAGSSTDSKVVSNLIQGCDVVVSCLGSPNKDQIIMECSAKALKDAIRAQNDEGEKRIPRILWMSSEGVNDGAKQAKLYGCTDGFLPSCNLCGWGCFGFLQSFLIIPFVISRRVWTDMALSENAFTSDPELCQRTVIVRPTVMKPFSKAPAFSEDWRKEGGDVVGYIVKSPSDPPPSIFMNRKSIAKFMIDAVENDEWDGKEAVQLFQGE